MLTCAYACPQVFGGFGFTQRQLDKHEVVYRSHGFSVLPVLSSIKQLISVELAGQRGLELAQRIQEADEDVVIHTVSGSFWTAIFTLAAMDPAWRERRVRAIMFDSCPPESNVYAFGGWLSWFLQAKTGLPAGVSKPIVSHLFHPIRPAFGIDATWTAANHSRMFDEEGCVVPKSAACLFVRGRNDPVLNSSYVDSYAAFLASRTSATVESRLFDRAQHAMAVVESPESYKRLHVDSLLAMVPEWRTVGHGDWEAGPAMPGVDVVQTSAA